MELLLQRGYKNRMRIYAIMVFICCSIRVQAQFEPMFTQYMFNETFINPAYVGSHENPAATLLYRNQWVGINGAPVTQTFTFHAPVADRRLGLGISAMNENIGVTHQLTAKVNAAYRLLFPNSALSFGLQGEFTNQEIKYTELNTITPGDNQFLSDQERHFRPNAGFGMYYYNDKFYAGISVPRVLENILDPSGKEHDSRTNKGFQYWHYYFATGVVLELNEDLKMKPSLMMKAVQNAPVEMDIDANFMIKDFLWLGCGFRTGDALSAMIGFQLTKQMRFGYSYDFTVSKLQRYNSGSHEFTLSYEFRTDKNKVISTRYF